MATLLSGGVEVADIFQRFGQAYRKKHKLPLNQLKAMSAIECCRTETMGGHVDECDSCGHLRISYNSCRNRHCPKCQSLAREKWLIARTKDLLPVVHFHVVFTIPCELNALALVNQRVIYSILFKAASQTLIQLGKDPKHLGAQIGFISVLHTWGQNLMDHPHLHCIVPGGGLSPDGSKWVRCRKKFFIPVKVISRLFRGKFLYYLKAAYQSDALKFVGKIEKLGTSQEFQHLLDKLYKKEWVVNAKKPFGGPEQVINYLGRYTHRVAISNHRIVKMQDHKVTFKWRDYNDNNCNKVMTLDVSEFIRRFLLHILPKGFFKIRYFGLLSSCNRKTKLKISKQILGVQQQETKQANKPVSWKELFYEVTGIDIDICTLCCKGKMIQKRLLMPLTALGP